MRFHVRRPQPRNLQPVLKHEQPAGISLQFNVSRAATGEPFVEVTFKNQQVERIESADLSVQKIMEIINARSAEMETAGSLKAAGFSDVKLHSRFGTSGASGRLESGYSSKILPT